MSSSPTLPRLQVADAHFVTGRLLVGGDLHHEPGRGLAELEAHRRVHDFDVREVIRRVRSAEGGSIDVG